MTCIAVGGMAGIDASIAAGSILLFSSLNPVVGAIFGATHAIVTLAVGGIAAASMNERDVERYQGTITFVSGALSAALTVGLAAGILFVAGIPFTLLTLTTLFLSLIVSSAVISLCCFAN